MKTPFVSAVTLLVAVSSVLAQEGPNPWAALAMHLIVTDDYLYCSTSDEWCPSLCTQIDNDARMEEILPGSLGYARLIFLVYNFDDMSSIEFALTGWPPTRGTVFPPVLTPCPTTATIVGNPWDLGATISFGADIWSAAPCGGVYCVAHASLNMYELQTWLPITLYYAPACLTMPCNNIITSISPYYYVDIISEDHSCTIGDYDPNPVPYLSCEPWATGTRGTSWGGVKATYR